jgi:N-acetylmuramoyl-L-alanine amidase
MKVALDIGHLYKDSNKDDKGTFYQGFYEADFALMYARKAYELLRTEHSIEVFISDPAKNILVGDYWKRRNWINQNFSETDLYIQCHLNSGKGNYALVMSVLGYLDEKIVPQDELGQIEITYGQILANNTMKFLGIPVKDFDEAKDMIWNLKPGDRGYDVVKKFKCPAFIYEPAFIDNIVHFSLLKDGTWIDAIAKAIWKACVEINQWIQDKGKKK